ncbi:MAG: hypothetical protein RLZZ416_306 [Candidatus Parcubacteria bacterium]|jgi:hypothetical protein
MNDSLKGVVMEAIAEGRVRMRPRWHFLIYSAFGVVGVAIVSLLLVYVASLAVFFMRESGALFTPSFGMRGWFVLLRGLPWILITLVLVFIALLQLLARRYRFVYQKPLIASLIVIVSIVFLGGWAVGESPLHRQLADGAHHGNLPPPAGFLYGTGLRPPREKELYHGVIARILPEGFILADFKDATSTVLISRGTRLPFGADFEPGDFVVVIGDETSTDTIRAFGIREVRE